MTKSRTCFNYFCGDPRSCSVTHFPETFWRNFLIRDLLILQALYGIEPHQV